jgi:hypothetical protein
MKTALIITDGTQTISLIAKTLSDALDAFNVKICEAKEFEGTDLLPADIFFIGCEKPDPDSFSYLEEMLSHINLASRKCGIFSVKEKTLKYLGKITGDCEADVLEPMLISKDEIKTAIFKKWIKAVVK